MEEAGEESVRLALNGSGVADTSLEPYQGRDEGATHVGHAAAQQSHW